MLMNILHSSVFIQYLLEFCPFNEGKYYLHNLMGQEIEIAAWLIHLT